MKVTLDNYQECCVHKNPNESVYLCSILEAINNDNENGFYLDELELHFDDDPNDENFEYQSYFLKFKCSDDVLVSNMSIEMVNYVYCAIYSMQEYYKELLNK